MADPIRYPVGEFVPVLQPQPEQRFSWAEDILQLPGILRSEVEGLTDGQLDTPYRDGGWTIRQVVHHLADNDMNAYFRFKRALTEEAPLAGSYRQDEWAELPDSAGAPVALSLALMEGLRGRFVLLVRSMAPADFGRTFTSPLFGVLTLDLALQRFVWHGRHHLAHITSLKRRMGW